MRAEGGRALPTKMANRDKEEAEVCLCARQRAGDPAGQSFLVQWAEKKRRETGKRKRELKTSVKETKRE